MIRLVAFADAVWVTLDADHPNVDLLRLPWRKLLNILYMENARRWYQHERTLRGEAGPEPTFDEFDYLLNASLPGGSERIDDTDFMSDYM